jgi:hypothetical protein
MAAPAGSHATAATMTRSHAAAAAMARSRAMAAAAAARTTTSSIPPGTGLVGRGACDSAGTATLARGDQGGRPLGYWRQVHTGPGSRLPPRPVLLHAGKCKKKKKKMKKKKKEKKKKKKKKSSSAKCTFSSHFSKFFCFCFFATRRRFLMGKDKKSKSAAGEATEYATPAFLYQTMINLFPFIYLFCLFACLASNPIPVWHTV